MRQHGRLLAGQHRLEPGRPKDHLLPRLAENESQLLEVHHLLMTDVKAEVRITPAGEWLLDNFYLIEEQIRMARRHLPKGYCWELPRLRDGPSAGLPRVYDIALETISHSDGRVDPERLSSFVAAYQSAVSLKLGELWAIPIMLRIALIENLRIIATRIAADRLDRNLAGRWADQLCQAASQEPDRLILMAADMVRSNPPLASAFVAELTRRLHGQAPVLAMPLTWMEQRLSDSGLTIEQMVRLEHQQQAANQVSMSNSIGSLRFLGAIDWRSFVETQSKVEQILRDDPAGVYERMDFATRDHYRHTVEWMAKRCPKSESSVARQALALAQAGAAWPEIGECASHVGYYLIDAGVPQLRRAIAQRLPPAGWASYLLRQFPFPLFAGAITLVTVLCSAGLLAQASRSGLPLWLLICTGLLAVLSTSQLAVALVNWLATLAVAPRLLPRLDFSKGIPPELRTLVVVPTMLSSVHNIEELIKALEIRYLANSDDNLHFALLTDLRDATEETLPQDEALVQLAGQRIVELNEKYPGENRATFFLFHRPRRWHRRDRIWMGEERKRGKLAALNALLRGDPTENFALVVGQTAVLAGVKYVITLDTDTQLARDSARQFVGAMAHPLNQPRYDAARQRVVAGYGILQPRVAESLSGADRSLYARLCANELGIDPYTRAVSDVYQDLFGEGSFIGKGIYDVDAFEQALRERLPANRILSHDLLEGCYARSGLISDVLLYEESPSRYNSDVSRRHRWTRGDWQIAQWLLPRVPSANAHFVNNPLTALSRFKIADNLRRSLAPAGLTLLLLLGWTVLPLPWFWTLAVAGIILMPTLLASLVNLFRKPADTAVKQYLNAALRAARRQVLQALFWLTCLPYEAQCSLDAMVRANWRMLATRKGLLEWNPSGEAARNGRSDLGAACQAMWIGPVLAVATALALSQAQPLALYPALPVLALWLASPVIAWWISRPLVHHREQITVPQVSFLRKLARRTWAFFETFTGPDDHWLPPDNYQEQPVRLIAHRTSPTNMGLALLANLTACDFGYLSTGRLIERTAQTLYTMEHLEQHQGHFFNWYDTETLKPLLPRYVSSVDSGNLAGHLLILRAGLLDQVDQPLLNRRSFAGLSDTLGIACDLAAPALPAITLRKLLQLQQEMDAILLAQPATLVTAQMRLEQLMSMAAEVSACLAESTPGRAEELAWWAGALSGHCRDALDELKLLAPWTNLYFEHRDLVDLPELEEILTLRKLAELDSMLAGALREQLHLATTEASSTSLTQLQQFIAEASQHARGRLAAIHELVQRCTDLAQMDYGFLYDEARHLLAIGYNVSECRRDDCFYDLLASEARFATFVAIAQGQLPQESWFALGRLLTTAGGDPILLSWSGSMFEYLMPLLVMPDFAHTLLNQTCKAVVARQIEYGKARGTPWGVSESGFYAVDKHLNYQYRAFGVPGLGLKRGLAEDLVVAPYASALALMVAPQEACTNLERLAAEGFQGRYGFYEAIDYTHSRLPRGKMYAVVQSFMAHHQGMSLLALSMLLLDRPLQKRFESDPLFQATLLLLQERIPEAADFFIHTTGLAERQLALDSPESAVRVFTSPDTSKPEVQLLSNGTYHVMVSNAGGGYSRWKNLAVSRWREDRTCDNWGVFCYLRDTASGEYWSAALQPALERSKQSEAIFTEGRVEFRDHTHGYDMHTEIAVSPEDDLEIRRIRLTNRAQVRRTIEATSYMEVVLAPPAADALHPAFSNLFMQTAIIPGLHAILCTRRPRSESEHQHWLLHLLTVHGGKVGEASFETDRMQFIGRGKSVVNPQALTGSLALSASALSGSEGSVLDPIAAIRYRITLEPGDSTELNLALGVAETREAALNMIEKYQDRRLANRVFELAWAHDHVLLRQLNISDADAQLYCRLASSIIYANATLRADPGVLAKNLRGQPGLWGYAISGDLPIVLLEIEHQDNLELVRQLVQAHAYWRAKGLAVDLVIWNEDHAGYRQLLHDQIMGLIAAGIEATATDQPGDIFVRPADQIAEEDRILIQTVARVIITDRNGTLAEQVGGRSLREAVPPQLGLRRSKQPEARTVAPEPRHDLAFFNGLGGFTPDGREYVVTTAREQQTPGPWANVLANPQFGTLVSESGAACTWAENAHEFRLTPWNNDLVGEACGEAIYIRDEERGHYWSPTPLPCRGATPYVTRHGFGYSVFEHSERGIRSELWIYVALDDAVKFSVLKLRNESGRSRRLSATGYVEWVLGDLRPKTAPHLITGVDPASGALLARNPYNTEFRGRTAFFDVDDPARTVTGDRGEFLGRNGTLSAPAALARTHLTGRTGAALDPCGAIQTSIELAVGEEREIIFRLGLGRDEQEAKDLVQRYRGSAAARIALDAVWQHWTHCLGAVSVETPDHSVNVLVNGWLLYQTLACRMWARNATYQSGGAFGFRDQLQDAMALLYARPRLLREHLILCAAHQFPEGDVQHWWHPPTDRGVRTHCSDDYLWLPLAASRYVLATGDSGVLDEQVHFIQGRAVNAEEDSYYDLPSRSEDTASLYEHCVRAIKHGLRFGVHGLPLIGTGDWNDGMNLVGAGGSGESVWLGFFLYEVLTQFSELARLRRNPAFAKRCTEEAAKLHRNLEQHGWDGGWYRRAYFDDGTPLGSAGNPECQIDSIAQSWAVLSGAGDTDRSRQAMDAVEVRLVRRESGLVQLLDPPFDKSALNPGYIKGYVPGVRENGGQYTHAAIWAAMAYARLGDSARAWEVARMINPINHTRTPTGVTTYKVEPYVMSADVYSAPPHIGRGGWSWYTGSAAWMYRLIVESLLGLRLEVDKLYLTPCLPADWTGFKLHYRYRETVYHIAVAQASASEPGMRVSLDGTAQPNGYIPLVDDHQEHWAEVQLAVVIGGST